MEGLVLFWFLAKADFHSLSLPGRMTGMGMSYFFQKRTFLEVLRVLVPLQSCTQW